MRRRTRLFWHGSTSLTVSQHREAHGVVSSPLNNTVRVDNQLVKHQPTSSLCIKKIYGVAFIVDARRVTIVPLGLGCLFSITECCFSQDCHTQLFFIIFFSENTFLNAHSRKAKSDREFKILRRPSSVQDSQRCDDVTGCQSIGLWMFCCQ